MKTLFIALLLVSTSAAAGLGNIYNDNIYNNYDNYDRSQQRNEEREYRRQQQEMQERQHREHMRQLQQQRMYPGGSITQPRQPTYP